MKIFYSDKKKWIVSILMKDINLLAGTLFLGLLGALLGLAVSVFSQKLIDVIIPSHNKTYLVIGLFIAAGLAFMKLGVSYTQQILGMKHSQRFNMRLIDKFFKRILLLPKSFYNEQQTGGLVARMNDSGSIQQTISYIANTLILNFLILVVSSAVLFYYSVTIGIMALLSFPFFLAIALIFKDKIAKKTNDFMNANARKESNYISSIQNIDLIKTHNKQDLYSEINYATYGEYQRRAFVLGKSGMGLGVLAESIGAFFYIMMLSYASYQAMTGGLSIGAFTATIGIATGMLYPIGAIGMAILQLQGAKVAFNRMYEFVSVEPEYYPEEDIKKDKIERIDTLEFKHVSFSYRKDVALLKDINFKVKRGEIVSIFGRNGSGKSTILNIIMAMYKADHGTILYNESDIKKLSITHLRERIAIVAQQSVLFDTTLIENICFDSNPKVVSETIEYLNKLGFEKYINLMSDGYHTVIHENGKNLSGGQKQIISLARALYKRPDILLLDEPTASLDGDSETFVMKIIKEYSKQGMAIMVTHKLKPARESHKILILENGVIQNTGNHNELILSDNFYSRRYSELVN